MTGGLYEWQAARARRIYSSDKFDDLTQFYRVWFYGVAEARRQKRLDGIASVSDLSAWSFDNLESDLSTPVEDAAPAPRILTAVRPRPKREVKPTGPFDFRAYEASLASVKPPPTGVKIVDFAEFTRTCVDDETGLYTEDFLLNGGYRLEFRRIPYSLVESD